MVTRMNWIPITSPKKPKPLKNVLVTAINRDGDPYVYLGYYDDIDDTWSGIDDNSIYHTQIIAWAELPTPCEQLTIKRPGVVQCKRWPGSPSSLLYARPGGKVTIIVNGVPCVGVVDDNDYIRFDPPVHLSEDGSVSQRNESE